MTMNASATIECSNAARATAIGLACAIAPKRKRDGKLGKQWREVPPLRARRTFCAKLSAFSMLSRWHLTWVSSCEAKR